jgi:NAD(P)-dependent dehydrogenase (short-subunit alcohol dehydrogenase family)
MGLCDGRVAVVTGAGRGIGRQHALQLAAHGAAVVVNDVGASVDGTGRDVGAAESVVAEIIAAGGQGCASMDDISGWDGGAHLIELALATYGRLDVVVNNAGILRDRMLVNMTETEWDAVVGVHLKGTFVMSRWAAAHWRDQAKAGHANDARLINTSSASGIYGNAGQINYGAAKAGIAAMTIIAAKELGRYGVTVNAIAPEAFTRMTLRPGQEVDPKVQELLDPRHVSPIVCWLASTESRAVTGRVFDVNGRRISVSEGWHRGPSIDYPDDDPARLGPEIRRIVCRARPNATMQGLDEKERQ